MPQELMEELAALNENIAALTAKVNLADGIIRRQRWMRLVGWIVLLLVVVVGANSLVQQSRTTHEICMKQNEVRLGNSQLWGNVLRSSPVPAPPAAGAPEATIQAYNNALTVRDQFSKDLVTYFSPLNC